MVPRKPMNAQFGIESPRNLRSIIAQVMPVAEHWVVSMKRWVNRWRSEWYVERMSPMSASGRA